MRTVKACALILLGLVTLSRAAEFEQSTLVNTPKSQTVQVRSEPVLVEQWGLTLEEWRRYQRLMHGIRGALSNPAISPLEVLGIHAETDNERRRYAERWVQLMFEDTARVLAFQREYHAAFKRLYPDVPAIDLRLLRRADSAASTVGLKSGERLLFFTALACEPCQQVLGRLLKRIDEQSISGLDIYVVDTPTGRAGDESVRTWAQAQAIPAEAVQSRQVTLNHDNGLLARLAPEAKPPHVLRQSPGGHSVLPWSESVR